MNGWGHSSPFFLRRTFTGRPVWIFDRIHTLIHTAVRRRRRRKEGTPESFIYVLNISLHIFDHQKSNLSLLNVEVTPPWPENLESWACLSKKKYLLTLILPDLSKDTLLIYLSSRIFFSLSSNLSQSVLTAALWLIGSAIFSVPHTDQT